FRAVGEGHISSVVFRRAMIDKNNQITIIPAGSYVDEAEKMHNTVYQKQLFLKKGEEADIDPELLKQVDDLLEDRFDYETLKSLVIEARNREEDESKIRHYNEVLALSDSYRKISFSRNTDISDRVIFPISDFERKGIEDARFVRFIKDDGQVIYYATYTAYDG